MTYILAKLIPIVLQFEPGVVVVAWVAVILQSIENTYHNGKVKQPLAA